MAPVLFESQWWVPFLRSVLAVKEDELQKDARASVCLCHQGKLVFLQKKRKEKEKLALHSNIEVTTDWIVRLFHFVAPLYRRWVLHVGWMGRNGAFLYAK